MHIRSVLLQQTIQSATYGYPSITVRKPFVVDASFTPSFERAVSLFFILFSSLLPPLSFTFVVLGGVYRK